MSERPGILRIRRATRPGTGLTRGFEPRHSPHAVKALVGSLAGAFTVFRDVDAGEA